MLTPLWSISLRLSVEYTLAQYRERKEDLKGQEESDSTNQTKADLAHCPGRWWTTSWNCSNSTPPSIRGPFRRIFSKVDNGPVPRPYLEPLNAKATRTRRSKRLRQSVLPRLAPTSFCAWPIMVWSSWCGSTKVRRMNERASDRMDIAKKSGCSRIGAVCEREQVRGLDVVGRKLANAFASRYTILPAMTMDGYVALDVVEGTVNKKTFTEFSEVLRGTFPRCCHKSHALETHTFTVASAYEPFSRPPFCDHHGQLRDPSRR